MHNYTIWQRRLPIVIASLMLGACSVGPDYVKPTVETPAAYKEGEGWKQAQPADTLLKPKWWELFNDTDLNRLEEQVTISNQNIALAAANYRQARALVEGAKAAYYPSLTVGASATRALGSANAGRSQGPRVPPSRTSCCRSISPGKSMSGGASAVRSRRARPDYRQVSPIWRQRS